MPPQLTLKFDANQDFQLQAIEAIAGLFEGYMRRDDSCQFGDEIVPNVAPLESFDAVWLGANLRAVQEKNGLPQPGLMLESEMELQGVSDGSWEHPSFTVEMETGTGKTYVYLRTIHELRRQYGWRKYIIVVPSIAIYEGVIKTFEITYSHFAALYGNERVNLLRYDGSHLSRLRSFATSTFCEVMVMTLDSFNKSTNLFYRPSEKLPGERKPYQFVQETRPIVVLDEPQNMQSEIARSAIATLHPLFSLRYSATHRVSPNLVYRLTPFEAFRRSLVKRIQVLGVMDSENYNRPFLSLKAVTRNGGIRACIGTYVLEGGQAKERELVLRKGEDLYARTRRDEHLRGYIVDEIDAGKQRLAFGNGLTLEKGVPLAPSRPEVFGVQIEETIRQHLDTQERLRPLGVKVLSLFFIDRVANYTAPNGLIRHTFDRAFRKLRGRYKQWKEVNPDQVRAAYFAKKRSNDGEQAIDIDPERGPSNDEQRQATKAAFELIMQDKERLLSLQEKAAFIFAHSALREGWDNPNVFQICTLNQTASELKKRQEIGRGLRLCVNQEGDRVRDDEINILTVVANESYERYARQLQQEYIDEGQGEKAPPIPGNARQAPARRNEALVATPEFHEFWRRLSQRIEYRINIDTRRLMKECVGRLAYVDFPAPKLMVEQGEYVVHRFTLTLEGVRRDRARIRLDTVDSRNRSASVVKEYRAGDDLALRTGNMRLRGYRVADVMDGAEPRVVFENKIVLYRAQPQRWESVEGQQVRRRVGRASPARHSIPDLLNRAARETELTRATLNEVFRQLPRQAKEALFRDPEGFSGIFITTIRSVLADHIADRLECIVTGDESYDLDEFFPGEMQFAQRELVAAGERGFYDHVQRDSGVEGTFIDRLKSDKRVVLFFKFPRKYLVRLPRLIGNYNPDWGIIRRGENGVLTLHLVRETKGRDELEQLQFPHEKRKIVGATKYFRTALIDYRVVTSQTVKWWESRPMEAVQQKLRVD